MFSKFVLSGLILAFLIGFCTIYSHPTRNYCAHFNCTKTATSCSREINSSGKTVSKVIVCYDKKHKILSNTTSTEPNPYPDISFSTYNFFGSFYESESDENSQIGGHNGNNNGHNPTTGETEIVEGTRKQN